jgi:hypothetical protein
MMYLYLINVYRAGNKMILGVSHMKLNKKATAGMAFVLGAALLATSAFADVILGSGYNGLKNSVKTTMQKLSTEVENFTVDLAVSIAMDDKVLEHHTQTSKYDMQKNASENISEDNMGGKITNRYSYSDMEKTISRNPEDDTYYVYENGRNQNSKTILDNPFEEEQAADIEKIVDAFVGSLSDVIQVVENDGKKMYTGNLSDAQVPPVWNALASYFVKYGVIDSLERNADGLKLPKNEIYVLSASGKAIENENGIIEELVGKLSLSGKLPDGTVHTYNAEMSITIKDINETVVTVPNLDGADVEYHQSYDSFGAKYIGKYKNDIVEEQKDAYVKLGERYLEITSTENDTVTGRYYEVYNDGTQGEDFAFTAALRDNFHDYVMDYTDKDGNAKTGVIGRSGYQNLHVALDVSMEKNGYRYNGNNDYDSSFIRVFE